MLGAALAPGGQPSHAYLFAGPAGSGKRAIARAFAAELLADGCADPDRVRARVQRGAHPDLTWVVPSGAHELLRRDVDEPVVAAAARTPFEGPRRVFVIERVDTMNDEAANRMLKTLEEPAGYVHLILLTDRPADVLATIVSRCQRVRFDPQPPQQLAEELASEGTEEQRALACARLALGDGRRARLLSGPAGERLRAAAERYARAPLRGETATRPWEELLAQARTQGAEAVEGLVVEQQQELELLGSRDRKRRQTEHAEQARRTRRRVETALLDAGLDLAALWYRDIGCIAWGAPEAVLAIDRLAQLREDAAGRAGEQLRHAQELVEQTRQRLALNVSEELACEALAYGLERLLAPR